ncbi:MAG: hypothetical protein ACRBBP_08515 [Bdellovibrionales bacterium]
MALELVLLISFVGLTIVSAMGGDSGLTAQFRESGPMLAARMEKRMATGRCFQTPVGGGSGPCSTIIFESASPKK